jgi:tetratricopeptide (TPR) repeat protein
MNFKRSLRYLLIGTLLSFCFYFNSSAQSNLEENGLRSEFKAFIERPDSIFLKKKAIYNTALLAGNLTLQGEMLIDMGEISFHLGHFPQTLQYYLDAAEVFQKVKRKDLLANSYNKLGLLYYDNMDSVNTKRSYNKAMLLYKELNDQQGIAFIYGKLGYLHEKKQRYDSAFIYQKKALAIYTNLKDKKGIAKIHENLGSIYEDLAKYALAMPYFQSALSNYMEAGEKVQVIEVTNNIGDIYRKTGDYKRALKQSTKALSLAKEKNEIHQISSAYRDISKVYNLMGKNDSAFYYAETARSYLMKIYSLESGRQMAFLHALYDDQKKNEEISTLQFEKRVNFIIRVATGVIFLLLVFAGFLLVSRQRAQKRLMEADLKNKELEEDQLKKEIELKSKELSTHVLHVIQKNQLLENLKVQLADMIKDDKRDQKTQLKHVINQIDQNFNNDTYWSDFSNVFKQLHHSFFENLNRQFPKLTASDLKLVSLLKMNLDSNDIAIMLAISQDSLKMARYRLRKKLNLDQGENLVSFLQSI